MRDEVTDSFSMFPLDALRVSSSGESRPKLSFPLSQSRISASVSLRSRFSGWTSNASQQMLGGWEVVVKECEGEGDGERRGVRDARRVSRSREGRSSAAKNVFLREKS